MTVFGIQFLDRLPCHIGGVLTGTHVESKGNTAAKVLYGKFDRTGDVDRTQETTNKVSPGPITCCRLRAPRRRGLPLQVRWTKMTIRTMQSLQHLRSLQEYGLTGHEFLILTTLHGIMRGSIRLPKSQSTNQRLKQPRRYSMPIYDRSTHSGPCNYPRSWL